MAAVPAVGASLGRYRIKEQIGRGGMGVVFRAFDEQLQRDVALKFTNPAGDEASRKRFRNEALALARLSNPYIGVIHGFETIDGLDVLVMEYISGRTLTEHIGGKPLPESQVIALGLQLSSALREAHESGVIHRDLKPGNILITKDGDAKVLDFGLAILRMGSNPTVSAVKLEGTVQYMAPEVLRGAMPDERSDIYAMGAVLYEMVTGRPPHSTESFGQLVEAVLYKAPVAPEQIVPGISAALSGVIKKCLETNPANRYQTAAALREDLVCLQSGTAIKLPSPIWPRNRWTRIAIAISIPLIAAVLLWMGTRIRTNNAAPPGRVIAVLPIESIGGPPENRALSRGLTDLITVRLAQVSQRYGFEVVPASEVRSQEITSADQARQKLGANLVVEGSWDFSGQPRIMYALVDATTKRNINAAVVAADIGNVYAAENDVYQQLLDMLNVQKLPKSKPEPEIQPSNPTAYAYYVRGRGYLGDYQDAQNVTSAITLFESATKEDPNFALAFAGLGEAYWRKYEESKDAQWVIKATSACQRAASLTPNLSNVQSTFGLIYQGTGKYQEAVNSFQEALHLDPYNDAASRGLASAYQSLGDFAKAETSYQQAISLRPDYWGGYHALGVFYFNRGQYKQAAEQFEKEIKLVPENVRAYTSLGGAYYFDKRYDDARRVLLTSLKMQPTYRGYSNLGTLDFFQQRYADAAARFEEALKLVNRDYRVWRNMASAYYWSGQKDKASTAFTRAANMIEEQRKVNPKDAQMLIALADCYSMLDEKQNAESALKEALALNPSDSESAFRATGVYEKLGNRDQALDWLKTAVGRGYLISEVEKDPSLAELRKDPRYRSALNATK